MNDIVPSINSNDENVVINIPKSKLSDFLGGVLKIKRRIQRRYDFIFDIYKDDVINIIEIIEYRIKEQNPSILADISVTVLFNDGSSREYSSKELFIAMEDNISATSVAIIIEFSYLISFAQEETPTKQEITVYINAKYPNSIWAVGAKDADPVLSILVESNRFTWAEDVINHFTNYLEGRFKKRNIFSVYISRVYESKTFSLFFMLITSIFLITMLTNFFAESVIELRKSEIYSSILNQDTISSANKKLNILLQRGLDVQNPFSNWKRDVNYIIYSLSYFFILVVLPLSFVNISKRCYVSIGKTSEKKNADRKKKIGLLMNTYIFGAILSVFLSVFANYIWSKIEYIFTN